MKKSEVKNLRKNQIVWYGGFPWKFYSASPVVKGWGKEATEKLNSGKCDYYNLSLKAIDGKSYNIVGPYCPGLMYLANQYWLGVTAIHKDVELSK